MKKIIDLTDKAVEILTIQAIKEKTVFKHYVQDILEQKAKSLTALKKPKRA